MIVATGENKVAVNAESFALTGFVSVYKVVEDVVTVERAVLVKDVGG